MKKKSKNIQGKGLKFGQILGINVAGTTIAEVLTGVEDKISHSSKFSILTPNPELVLSSARNLRLKQALNSADFPVPDGIGLSQAAKYLSFSAPKNKMLRLLVTFCQGLLVGAATFINRKWLTDQLNIIPGRKLFLELVKLANQEGWKVFLLGGTGDEAKLAVQKLENRYRNWKIESSQGPILNQKGEAGIEVDRKAEKDAIDKINKFGPELLFVAFGNPKQEIWIHENLSKLKIGGAMAVGGTFRYVAGLSLVPPKWMESIGLEWLWRFITEPKRFGRIWNAVVVFPFKVFWYRLTH